jgi:small subunit ribosomal protein S8
MTDPIADLLNRINNSKNSSKDVVEIPYSRVKESIAKVLKDEGYIGTYSTDKENGLLLVSLVEARKVFKNMVRYSKPGRRVYVSSRRIPRPKSGFGIVVISTPLGVLSGNKARKSGVGGEVICEVY